MAPATRSRRKAARSGAGRKTTSKARAATGGKKTARRPKPAATRSSRKKTTRRAGALIGSSGARARVAAPSVRPAPAALAPPSEEEQIESSKYLPRHAPDRVFEEERFVFPESYGTNRLRLLVKDPEWLFAHWDVDPKVLATLRQDLGGRAVALSRLTLRVADPAQGGTTVILLPKGARGWYVRSDGSARTYRAELGLTLPSGEFRALAVSNVVRTPRVGPSDQPARTRVKFRRNGQHVAAAAGALDSVVETGAGPLKDSRVVGEREGQAGPAGRRGTGPGGASDEFRPQAGAAGRRGTGPGGASDEFRR